MRLLVVLARAKYEHSLYLSRNKWTYLRSIMTSKILNLNNTIPRRPMRRWFGPSILIFLFNIQVEVYHQLTIIGWREDLHSLTRSTLFIDISAAAYILTIQRTYSVNETIISSFPQSLQLVHGKGGHTGIRDRESNSSSTHLPIPQSKHTSKDGNQRSGEI
jgi:hypothetical protein